MSLAAAPSVLMLALRMLSEQSESTRQMSTRRPGRSRVTMKTSERVPEATDLQYMRVWIVLEEAPAAERAGRGYQLVGMERGAGC